MADSFIHPSRRLRPHPGTSRPPLPTRLEPIHTPDEPPQLLRPKDAANILAISERKLWELQNCGAIPCLRIGRAVRFDVQDLREWIDRQKVAGHA